MKTLYEEYSSKTFVTFINKSYGDTKRKFFVQSPSKPKVNVQLCCINRLFYFQGLVGLRLLLVVYLMNQMSCGYQHLQVICMGKVSEAPALYVYEVIVKCYPNFITYFPPCFNQMKWYPLSSNLIELFKSKDSIKKS